MKHCIVILQFIFLVLLQGLSTVKCENNRKWLEMDNILYRIEPQGKYTWNEAKVECQKEHSSLISPQGAYDYSKLNNFIKKEFTNYSSFWTNTQIKVPSVLTQIGLGESKHGQQKCNKFEKDTFKYLLENCEKSLGFICEKPLKQGLLHSYVGDKEYYIQSDEQYTCEQANAECEHRQMALVICDEYASNSALKNYIFLNKGDSPRFWLSLNDDKTDNDCTPNRGGVNSKTKLGVICEKTIEKTSTSMRHLILIVFLSGLAVIAIIGFVVVKCCIRYKVKSLGYKSEIPELVKDNSDSSF